MRADPSSIPILAAGQGWLVVEKPSGLSVQEEPGADLCSALRSRIGNEPDLLSKIDWNPLFGVQAVHRLDRETSGVILLACRPETFAYFAVNSSATRFASAMLPSFTERYPNLPHEMAGGSGPGPFQRVPGAAFVPKARVLW